MFLAVVTYKPAGDTLAAVFAAPFYRADVAADCAADCAHQTEFSARNYPTDSVALFGLRFSDFA